MSQEDIPDTDYSPDPSGNNTQSSILPSVLQMMCNTPGRAVTTGLFLGITGTLLFWLLARFYYLNVYRRQAASLEPGGRDVGRGGPIIKHPAVLYQSFNLHIEPYRIGLEAGAGGNLSEKPWNSHRDNAYSTPTALLMGLPENEIT
ncbi:hypothetical protein B0T19DRAFT_405390 [Cercophora scortea]|uniref:Uncharacterized protein n=1 Tax=Cercophora scortea TaxID=314031 RepID=A0AAE0M4M2_9PEZI|nr:hypothetical protein B0T19DRAFT_405390 [Cercophora scortea]